MRGAAIGRDLIAGRGAAMGRGAIAGRGAAIGRGAIAGRAAGAARRTFGWALAGIDSATVTAAPISSAAPPTRNLFIRLTSRSNLCNVIAVALPFGPDD